MIINSIRKNIFKSFIIPLILITSSHGQQIEEELFFDGPHFFYDCDSIIINYYNYGVKESFRLNIRDTNTFKGYLQDSLVLYSIPYRIQPECEIYSDTDKIFAISDIHGQYEIFRKLLQRNGIINENDDWIFGAGHLVIVGDVFDRGNQVHEALWLIYNLENQALAVGGKVHLVLGNHEIMVLQNDLRYVTDKYFKISDSFKIDLPELYNIDTFWGRWLRSKNVITKIGSYLFVHGGINPDLMEKYDSFHDINRLIRDNIDTDRDIIKNTQELSDLFRSNGPIWYRGFFEPDTSPKVTDDDLTKILEYYDVERIIVGHTTIDSIQAFSQQRLFNVDGGIKYGESGEGLLILNSEFYSADTVGKRRPLL